MAAYPGYGGQPFSPVTIQKIEKSCVLRSKYGARFDIGVDGAVNIKTVAKIVKAGANYLIAGSSIFRDDVTKNIKILKEIADETMRTAIV
jgi:ribulose-phosphate 3-epimerase